MLQATWTYRSMPGMKSLADSQLRKMFVMPKYRFILPDKPIYHELKLEKYAEVEYGKIKAHHCLFHTDLSNADKHYEWIWYGTAKGGSACSYGPTFMFRPDAAAEQTAFWLPLEIWCCFPEKYKEFSKCATLSIRLDNDNVPIKAKRIWLKKFIEALTSNSRKSK